MSAQLEQVKKNCGYDPASPKWISRGGELMKYLGMEVMRLDFKKNDKGEWENSVGKSLLLQANKYDPNTETLELVWKDVDYSKPESEWEIKKTEIVPPGFSFGNPEEKGEMTRFIPYSLHMEKIETEAFYAKLGYLFRLEGDLDRSLVLPELMTLASSRDRVNSLCHIHYIAVVIKPVDTEDVYIYRLGDIGIRHQFKSAWKITAKDDYGKNEITLYIEEPEEKDITNMNHVFQMRDAGRRVEAEVKFFDLRNAFRCPTEDEKKNTTNDNTDTSGNN